GLAWAGNPRHVNDAARSLPPDRLTPILDTPGIRFVSLQKDTPLPGSAAAPGILDLADTAALIGQLDLVISVDTMVAHLAGALGRPVWLLLSFAPDWRWMTGREDSPWYPTMRLFRQTA